MFRTDITRSMQYFRNLSNSFINILAIFQRVIFKIFPQYYGAMWVGNRKFEKLLTRFGKFKERLQENLSRILNFLWSRRYLIMCIFFILYRSTNSGENFCWGNLEKFSESIGTVFEISTNFRIFLFEFFWYLLNNFDFEGFL